MIAIALLVFTAAGCGGSDSNVDSIVGYNYWFLGTGPYDFAGSNAENPAVQQAAVELLHSRIIDFAPSLNITVYPAYSESLALNRMAAQSYTGQYIGPGGITAPADLPILEGDADYTSGSIVIDLNRDATDLPAEISIEYSFDQAKAGELVQFMKSWRYEDYLPFGVSTDSVPAEVVIRGLPGTTGDLTCRQNLHCVASHWIAL
jgi:hypothetical protein